MQSIIVTFNSTKILLIFQTQCYSVKVRRFFLHLGPAFCYYLLAFAKKEMQLVNIKTISGLTQTAMWEMSDAESC